MADFMQIIDVNESGVERVLHPETNADFVIPGIEFKVPTIVEINDWINRSRELVEARKGKATLKLKLDEIDTALIPTNLLAAIKGVDGSGSGLDADTVDGKTVDDLSNGSSNLWTAAKTQTELDNKFNKVDVVVTATPNKVLKLDASGNLPTNITKNAATATRFQTPVRINFTGDVLGSLTFSGNEGNRTVDMQIRDNSHNHNQLNGDNVLLNATGTEKIVDFSVNGEQKSMIDLEGNFSGSSARLMGFEVNNLDEGSLWTGSKIKTEALKIATDESTKIVEEELLQYASRTENGLALGPVLFQKGQVDISGVNSFEFEIPVEAAEIMSESFILTSSDNALTFVKSETSTGKTMKFFLNKYAPFGTKLNWYITSLI